MGNTTGVLVSMLDQITASVLTKRPVTSDCVCLVPRFPTASAAQRGVHALPLMDALQQGRGPTREKTPQRLWHRGALDEAGAAQAAMTRTSVVNQPDRRERKARARPTQPERGTHSGPRAPPSATVHSHNVSWCWIDEFRLNSGHCALHFN